MRKSGSPDRVSLDDATRAVATSTGRWEIRDIDRHAHDPNRQAKLYKVRPDLFFPDAEYSLWIDGNISLIYPFDIHRLISLFWPKLTCASLVITCVHVFTKRQRCAGRVGWIPLK